MRNSPFGGGDPFTRSLASLQRLDRAAVGMSRNEVRWDAFTRAGCLLLSGLRTLRVGANLKVGGLIADGVCRPPAAKGTAFIRLQEPRGKGMLAVIIPQKVYLNHREALGSAFVIADGVLRTQGVTMSVVA